jgi:hypothetical protein
MSDTEKLKDAVSEMAALAAAWQANVQTLAGMALTELARSPTASGLLRVAHALQMIVNESGSMHNCIDVQAEQVGLNHINELERARRHVIYEALRDLPATANDGWPTTVDDGEA